MASTIDFFSLSDTLLENSESGAVLSRDTTCDSAISLKLPVKQPYLYFLYCISLVPQLSGVQ